MIINKYRINNEVGKADSIQKYIKGDTSSENQNAKWTYEWN